ncbi:MAG TPA: hypothetical protein VJI97_04910 [Candidatus Nanoarchaeia archaeon]|nr:hypothetical protein [Candidatus Nanoarchaeia archaeon]
MTKKNFTYHKYWIIGGVIGLIIGILPFFSTIFFDNPLEIILALPIIPISFIFKGGHPPLALFLSPLVYCVLGIIIGGFIYKIGNEK